MILIINISNSNNLNKFWVGIFRVTSIKFTKRQSVSEWVSESVSDKHSQWSDSGPIKNKKLVYVHILTEGNVNSRLDDCIIGTKWSVFTILVPNCPSILLCHISLFLGCWNIADGLVGLLTKVVLVSLCNVLQHIFWYYVMYELPKWTQISTFSDMRYEGYVKKSFINSIPKG